MKHWESGTKLSTTEINETERAGNKGNGDSIVSARLQEVPGKDVVAGFSSFSAANKQCTLKNRIKINLGNGKRAYVPDLK